MNQNSCLHQKLEIAFCADEHSRVATGGPPPPCLHLRAGDGGAVGGGGRRRVERGRAGVRCRSGGAAFGSRWPGGGSVVAGWVPSCRVPSCFAGGRSACAAGVPSLPGAALPLLALYLLSLCGLTIPPCGAAAVACCGPSCGWRFCHAVVRPASCRRVLGHPVGLFRA